MGARRSSAGSTSSGSGAPGCPPPSAGCSRTRTVSSIARGSPRRRRSSGSGASCPPCRPSFASWNSSRARGTGSAARRGAARAQGATSRPSPRASGGATARGTGAVLHVGHVERFNGAVQELKKIVERPLLVESRRLGPFEPRVQKDTVVMDLMIHDLDIVLGLVDSPPRRLTAMGSTVHSGSVDVATVQIAFESGTLAIITASRATEEKIRTLAVTQPDAYVVLDYSEQDIRIHRRAAQEYTLNRESIRYRRASFVEHVQVHKDNPLKLEILHLARAVKRARAGQPGVLAPEEDVRSLAIALEIERMIRDGRGEVVYPSTLPWSDHSA